MKTKYAHKKETFVIFKFESVLREVRQNKFF